ncbi:hypothetical protein L2734_16770, partial [Parashewanella spongiae]|uniref:hypothetical protein n=1 Tax=Parashewanella spongiae TaxID=342950 RepID=UPI00200F6386
AQENSAVFNNGAQVGFKHYKASRSEKSTMPVPLLSAADELFRHYQTVRLWLKTRLKRIIRIM